VGSFFVTGGIGNGPGWFNEFIGRGRTREERCEVKQLDEHNPVFVQRNRSYHDEAQGPTILSEQGAYRLGCGHNIQAPDQWGPSCWKCRKTLCVQCALRRVCNKCTRTACDEHSVLIEEVLFCADCASSLRTWKAVKAVCSALRQVGHWLVLGLWRILSFLFQK
jgi:hypothetical protein